MTSDPAPALLSARDVAVWRGGRTVCAVEHLVLQAGQGVWLRGRNGSGKTSLLRVLAGLSAPESGVIERAAGASVLFIGHTNALKEDLTVAENLRFLASLNALRSDTPKLRGALNFWGLWQRRHALVRTLSQGLKRRVALSRLDLAGDKALWLLDEPFDALDDEAVALLYRRLAAHQSAGGALALTSHTALRPNSLQIEARWLDQPDTEAAA